MSDPYTKLRPRGPTPPEDCCSCAPVKAVYLAHALTDNPVYCAECRGEVAPEKIGFDIETAEAIAEWNMVYGAIFALWLDSGPYESWAEHELRDRESAVNREGLRVRKALSAFLPCRYLWFWSDTRPSRCPVCEAEMKSAQSDHLLCASCNIYV